MDNFSAGAVAIIFLVVGCLISFLFGYCLCRENMQEDAVSRGFAKFEATDATHVKFIWNKE